MDITFVCCAFIRFSTEAKATYTKEVHKNITSLRSKQLLNQQRSRVHHFPITPA